MAKRMCGNKCQHYGEDGWQELPVCRHPKVVDKDGHGKYIYDYPAKLSHPKWCPMEKK